MRLGVLDNPEVALDARRGKGTNTSAPVAAGDQRQPRDDKDLLARMVGVDERRGRGNLLKGPKETLFQLGFMGGPISFDLMYWL
jgi:hypothetical protein